MCENARRASGCPPPGVDRLALGALTACGRPWNARRAAAALAHDGPALVHVVTDRRDISPYGGGGRDAV